MLKKLYSDTGLLINSIPFLSGINIIYGKYSESKEAKGINGIGKSSVIRLINFLLLSDSAEKEFDKEKYDFLRNEKHSISLEFLIDGISYTTTRYFEDVNKIFFGKTGIDQDVEYEKSELLLIFRNLFFPQENREVYLEGNIFRTLMQFFIKDDIQNKGRKDASNFFSFTPSAADKASYNFYLLGLPTKHIIDFNEIYKEYKRYSEALKTFEEKLKIETGLTVKEYRSERLRIESNIHVLKERTKTFDFKDTHNEIERRLSDLTTRINSKSKEFHSLTQKMKNLREAYQSTQDVDTRQIQKIYNEVISNFGYAVKKSLDEVQQFKSEILINRNKFLLNREKELQKSLDIIFKDLASLENERSLELKAMQEDGVLDTLERTYEALIKEETAYEKQNQILKQVDDYNRILSDQDIVVSQVRKHIGDDIQNAQRILDDLRQLFIEILNATISLDENDNTGYFDVALNHSNKKGTLPFKIEVNIPKSSSVGQEGLKILSYDLMIFLNAIQTNRRLPKFLIHDGVFHGMSHKSMVNVLNYIYQKHLQLYSAGVDFQYIVTFSEDDIVIPVDKKNLYGEFKFEFDDNVIVEVEDVKSKMLFKRDFK